MRTSSTEITVIAPRCHYGSINRTRRVQIASNGHLLLKRLRRFLIAQQISMRDHPDDHMVVIVPSEIILDIVCERHKMSNSISRMGKALDRKTQLIDEQADRIAGLEESCSLLLGALLDLMDTAKEFRDAYVNKDEDIAEKQATLSNQIEMIDSLIADITVEPDEAEEEEKDDQC